MPSEATHSTTAQQHRTQHTAQKHQCLTNAQKQRENEQHQRRQASTHPRRHVLRSGRIHAPRTQLTSHQPNSQKYLEVGRCWPRNGNARENFPPSSRDGTFDAQRTRRRRIKKCMFRHVHPTNNGGRSTNKIEKSPQYSKWQKCFVGAVRVSSR